MAGKERKKREKEARKAAKKRRKQANYLRHGPKIGHSGRRQKRNTRTFKAKTPRGPLPLPKTSAKGRQRRRRTRLIGNCSRVTGRTIRVARWRRKN